MKPLIALASAVAISFASFPAAFAETRGGNDCPPGQQSCSDTSARGPATKPGKASHEKGGQEKAGQDKNKPGKAAQKSGKSAHAGPKKGTRKGAPTMPGMQTTWSKPVRQRAPARGAPTGFEHSSVVMDSPESLERVAQNPIPSIPIPFVIPAKRGT